MNSLQVKSFLSKELGFTDDNLDKLQIFHDELLKFNKKYNLISKSTENDVWHRHILDSAQIIKYIEFSDGMSLSDLGTGAGFPGIVLAIYNNNDEFHVKLHEKSPVKCDFLSKVIDLTETKANIVLGNCLDHPISSDYLVCRAFKKIAEILRISREITVKSHKIIVLKGKNAQEEIKSAFQDVSFKYKLVGSITDKESKIFMCNVIKGE